MSTQDDNVVFGTEDLLRSLCDSVSKVLTVATHSEIRYSGMVQRITKTCLKPDIGCFVLFDGGFSGLVVINFSAQAAMELYEKYLLNMGMSKSDLASSYTSDEVSNVMGELMNQIVGDFIRLCEANFSRFGQTPNGLTLEGRDADLYQSFELAHNFMVEVIANGANRNSLCQCGSGNRYKHCHEHNLRRLIDGLSSVL